MKPNSHKRFVDKVHNKARRKLKVHKREQRSVWMGLSTMGIVGWSVAVPTLFCLFLGIWLDKHYRMNFSWTLNLLIIGIFIGCFGAWRWLASEAKQIHEEERDD